MLFQKVVEKLPVFFRYSFVQLGLVEPAAVTSGKFSGHQQVDAVRLVSDLVFDPLQFHSQVLEGVPGHAEYA